MRLAYKQLIIEIFKNRVFVFLMVLSSAFTSAMYYFVHFSIDGNLRNLDSMAALSDNQVLYRNGMVSNGILAGNVLMALTALTGIVFLIFFYRFFKTGARQIGCLKSLGFKDLQLCGFFTGFTALLTLTGAATGLIGAYFVSDVLIEASAQSYLVTGLVKELDVINGIIGFAVPAAVFCIEAYLMYGLIRGRETGLLLSDMGGKSTCPAILGAAHKIAGIAPAGSRLSIRLALRKPVAVLLIVISSISFSVMFLLGYSLTLSSGTVFRSQTEGHDYLYETRYDVPMQEKIPEQGIHGEKDTLIRNETLRYLDGDCTIMIGQEGIQRTAAALEENEALFRLQDERGNAIALPKPGQIVVGMELQELYGIKAGDRLTVLMGGQTTEFTVSAVAFNVKTNWIYAAKEDLTAMLSLPAGAYTGFYSMEDPGMDNGDTKGQEAGDGLIKADTITNEQKLESLSRSFVSNRSSAVINQAVGCLVGVILLYLALFMNFEDSTRDILILHLMGYEPKEIRKMLIHVYQPVLWLAFFLTLLPSAMIVRSVLRSLSIQIGDYLPFETNVAVIIGIFVLQTAVCYLVQATFHKGIRRVTRKENYADYTG